MKTSIFPKIMGIVNVTPDSFSDGGKYYDFQNALNYSLKLIDSGIDIIDIGGESTRPGAEPVSEKEEIERVIPLIKELSKYNISISIDTTKYEVARAALENGANIINDISGLEFEPRFAKLAAEYNAKLVIMHIKGTPATMQLEPKYDDVVEEIKSFLYTKAEFAFKQGVKNIILDPGIGFGKTFEHNIEILRNLELFKFEEAELMVGISRKTFIGKLLDIDNPQERDIPTALFHSLLLDKPVDIIRVHNTTNLLMLKKIFNKLYNEE